MVHVHVGQPPTFPLMNFAFEDLAWMQMYTFFWWRLHIKILQNDNLYGLHWIIRNYGMTQLSSRQSFPAGDVLRPILVL